jgi:hypothetical protein
MSAVETAHAPVKLKPDRRSRKQVFESAHEMAQRVTAEGVSAKEEHVNGQHERPHPETESDLVCMGILKPQCIPNIVRKEDQKEQGQVHEISVKILKDQREPVLAPI